MRLAASAEQPEVWRDLLHQIPLRRKEDGKIAGEKMEGKEKTASLARNGKWKERLQTRN